MKIKLTELSLVFLVMLRLFFRTIVKPQLEIINSIKEQFKKNELEEIDTDELIKRVDRAIGDLDIGDLLPDNYDHSSYQIMYHTLEMGEIDDVWLLDDSDCYINLLLRMLN